MQKFISHFIVAISSKELGGIITSSESINFVQQLFDTNLWNKGLPSGKIRNISTFDSTYNYPAVFNWVDIKERGCLKSATANQIGKRKTGAEVFLFRVNCK